MKNSSVVDRIRRADIIQHYAEFDALWYESYFPDVRLSGLSPAQHFCAFGMAFGRPMRSRAEGTPTYSSDMLGAALLRRPKISFCIPIMNRPDDIRSTLAWNLEENCAFSEVIEFVLIFMDEDINTHDWVRRSFPNALKSGFLRMIVKPPLDSWHFGKAKNQHRQHATGQVFSSLDGDNFVTPEEVRQLLNIMNEQGDHFIFHHFTGTWGDGSSGRISTSMALYREIGYDELLMPRQFDEMDFIFSALASDPSLPLLRTEASNHALSSSRSLEFVEKARLTNPVIQVDTVERRSPLNPKSDSYVADDSSMEVMQTFNQWACFAKNSASYELKLEYLKRLVDARHKIVDCLTGEKLLQVLFFSDGFPDPQTLEIGPEDICLFSCMKNDDMFLMQFYERHKALGVAHFFIIDDCSDTSVRRVLPFKDVHVFRPKVGSFSTSKGMWIDALIKAYLKPGQWALTLDADEILDLPGSFESLIDLGRELRSRAIEAMPALLIDLVPGPEVHDENLAEIGEATFYDVFDHYIFMDRPPEAAYLKHHSIKWGFGAYSGLSWHLDTRYHAFGTFDALRKIPLFQARACRHVNQGFHTLHYTDETSVPKDEIWGTPMALTIRHYKLVKLFSEAARSQIMKSVVHAAESQYHSRTSQNIAKIFGDGSNDATKGLMTLPSRPMSDGFLKGIDPRLFFTS